MNRPGQKASFIRVLLDAQPSILGPWIEEWNLCRLLLCLATIGVGAGLYGASMGWWRSGMQAVYTGIKIPLVILSTTLCNSLLNAMLAPLLGLNLGFRQSFMAVLLTFTIASVVLGGFAPVALFVVWNTPPLHPGTQLVSPEYGFLQLCLVGFIASAGVVGNVSLFPLLREWSGSRAVARRVLLAWLAGNLFLGSQICWILRPFIWDPARPVEFVGPQALQGSFFETVIGSLLRLL